MHIDNLYSLLWGLFLVCLLCISHQTLAAYPKNSAALIIGNHYNSRALNVVYHDAKAIAETLKDTHHFQIFQGYNLNRVEMRALIDRFLEYLPNVNGVIFVYLGMYGIQTKKTRHDPYIPYLLLPTDYRKRTYAHLSKGIDITLSILKPLEGSQAGNGYVSIIVLDTCHKNHPYSSSCAVQKNLLIPDNSILAYVTNNKIQNRTVQYNQQSRYVTHLIQGIKAGIPECQRIDDIFRFRIDNRVSEGRSHYRGGAKIPYFDGCSRQQPVREWDQPYQTPNQPGLSGTLIVRSNVRRATVFINGKRSGSLTRRKWKTTLPEGSYLIKLESQNKSQTKSVEITPGTHRIYIRF